MHDIKIHDVSFSYAGSDKLVLKDINVDVEGGEFVCILGQSGCGKSTLLRLIAGLEDCTTGEILVDGEKIHGASLNRGVVFQDYGLFPWKTAGANITLALKKKFPDWDKNHLKERTIELLKAVGLDESVYRKYPKELSGGMKQRCAIASAFGIDPPILLMDEPFGALDAVTRSMLQDMVLKLWEKQEDKKTVFFVTHDVDEAMILANRIIVLGQSPSNIIFDVKIPDEKRTTRDSRFEDPESIKLRNELLRQIKGYRYSSEETTRVLDPYHVHVVIDRLAAVREAVGPDVDIIMENHSYIDAQVAVQLGEQAKKYNILFFEEPTTPNPKMNKFVCDKLNIPIAQGERIYSRWGYAPYFEDGSIQLIQPDIGNCGGLTEAKKICDLAHIYDVGVQAHVCASPLSTAVALQLEAAIPNFTIHEHHVYNRYDYNKKLCKYDYQPVDGYIAVPDLPGIGNELTDYCFTNGKVTTIE